MKAPKIASSEVAPARHDSVRRASRRDGVRWSCGPARPHILRHTTAVHLLRSGVDINTIRAWLGHVSLDTTHIYAEVDLEMKAKALACVDISGLPTTPPRRKPVGSVMDFMRRL